MRERSLTAIVAVCTGQFSYNPYQYCHNPLHLCMYVLSMDPTGVALCKT